MNGNNYGYNGILYPSDRAFHYPINENDRRCAKELIKLVRDPLATNDESSIGGYFRSRIGQVSPDDTDEIIYEKCLKELRYIRYMTDKVFHGATSSLHVGMFKSRIGFSQADDYETVLKKCQDEFRYCIYMQREVLDRDLPRCCRPGCCNTASRKSGCEHQALYCISCTRNVEHLICSADNCLWDGKTFQAVSRDE